MCQFNVSGGCKRSRIGRNGYEKSMAAETHGSRTQSAPQNSLHQGGWGRKKGAPSVLCLAARCTRPRHPSVILMCDVDTRCANRRATTMDWADVFHVRQIGVESAGFADKDEPCGRTGKEKMTSTPTSEFTRVLVGIDLADQHHYVSEDVPASTSEAIQRAVWAAKANSAELCFLFVLPPDAAQLSYDKQMLLAEAEDYRTVFDHAKEVLAVIANSASLSGVKTSSRVVLGTSWIEIIRQVIRSEQDLVVVGTRKRGPFSSMLFGHTGIKLLRKCPCAVWVTRPQPDEQIASILVAHDLTEVGELAMELGCWLAREQGAALHVLHAIECKRPTAADRDVRLEAADERIRDELARFDLGKSDAQVHMVSEPAEHAILSYVDQHSIQLVVMGTVARTGIPGLIVGNTAEKLLPFLPCSVLAVKPDGFTCPVRLNDDDDDSI